MNTSATIQRKLQYRKVLATRHLTPSTYVLRFEREGLEFAPGQYLSVGPKGDINMREYSIYSPTTADYLEILIKEVDSGYVSKKLKVLSPGDEVYVEGPFGFFTLNEEQRQTPLFFIGTGTGISPFHCFNGSYSHLPYTLVHGVRTMDERYEYGDYDSSKIVSCVSQEEGGDYSGRVTGYLRTLLAEGKIPPNGNYYLCGNCDMIYEVYDILTTAEVPAKQIFAEVYF